MINKKNFIEIIKFDCSQNKGNEKSHFLNKFPVLEIK